MESMSISLNIKSFLFIFYFLFSVNFIRASVWELYFSNESFGVNYVLGTTGAGDTVLGENNVLEAYKILNTILLLSEDYKINRILSESDLCIAIYFTIVGDFRIMFLTESKPAQVITESYEKNVDDTILYIINYVNSIQEETVLTIQDLNLKSFHPYLFSIKIENVESYETILPIEDYLLYSDSKSNFWLHPGIEIICPIIFNSMYSNTFPGETYSDSFFVGLQLTKGKASSIKNNLEQKYPDLTFKIVQFENTFQNYYNSYYAEYERRKTLPDLIEVKGP